MTKIEFLKNKIEELKDEISKELRSYDLDVISQMKVKSKINFIKDYVYQLGFFQQTDELHFLISEEIEILKEINPDNNKGSVDLYTCGYMAGKLVAYKKIYEYLNKPLQHILDPLAS